MHQRWGAKSRVVPGDGCDARVRAKREHDKGWRLPLKRRASSQATASSTDVAVALTAAPPSRSGTASRSNSPKRRVELASCEATLRAQLTDTSEIVAKLENQLAAAKLENAALTAKMEGQMKVATEPPPANASAPEAAQEATPNTRASARPGYGRVPARELQTTIRSATAAAIGAAVKGQLNLTLHASNQNVGCWKSHLRDLLGFGTGIHS